MARDAKLSDWTWSDVTSGAGTLKVNKSTPTGRATDSGASIGLFLNAAGTSIKAVSNYKNISGFITSIESSTSFDNWLAGTEENAVVNSKPLIGNTSLRNMFAKCIVGFTQLDSTNDRIDGSAGAFFVLEGTYDDGFGSPADTWVPISGAMPLVVPVVALSNVAPVSNTLTTALDHGLVVGDKVTFTASFTGVTAQAYYNVLTVPSSNTFTLSALNTPTTTLTVTGTPSNVSVRKLFNRGSDAIATAPLFPTLRPYVRWAFYYSTTSITTNMPIVTIRNTEIVIGRDSGNAI